MASVDVNQRLAAAAAACEDKKAEDIRILALDPAESGLADYFLICTGNNDRQTVAITDEIELRLKREYNTLPNSVEGRRQGEWVLMDYVDFIVHVFLPEKRAFYGLERLRKSATTLSVDELNSEITSAIQAKRPVRAAGKATAKKTATKKTATKKAVAKKATAKKGPTARKAVAKSAVAGGAKKAVAARGKTAPKPATKVSAKKRAPRV